MYNTDRIKKRGPVTPRRIFFAAFLFIAAVAADVFPQESFVNEIEFAPYIVMPEEILYRLAEDRAFILYDIRPSTSYEAGHITEAVHFEWQNGETDVQEARDISGFFPPDIDIFLIDGEGDRSFDLLRYLLIRGHERVRVVEGGMRNWPYREYLVRTEP